MNDSTLAAEENSGSKQQSHITEAVIRIAGNSQDGIQSIGGFLPGSLAEVNKTS